MRITTGSAGHEDHQPAECECHPERLNNAQSFATHQPGANHRDLDRAEQETASAGGEVTRPATEIPGIGKIAIVTDASGALIGLIEPALAQLDENAKTVDHDLIDEDDAIEFAPELATANGRNARYSLPN